MTQSKETFKKVRVNTYVSGVFAVASLITLGILYFKVSELTESYGQIKRDISYYEQAIMDSRTTRDLLSEENARLVSETSVVSESLRELEFKRLIIQEEVAHRKQQVEESQYELGKLKNQISEAQSTILEATRLENEIPKLRSNFERMEMEYGKLSSKKRQLESENSRLTSLSVELSSEIDSLKNERDVYLSEVGSLAIEESNLRSIQINIEALTNDVLSLEAKEEGLEKSINKLRTSEIELSANVDLLKSKHNTFRLEAEKYTRSNEIIINESRDLAATIEELSAKKKKQQSELEQLDSKHRVIKDQITSSTNTLANNDGLIRNKKANLANLNQQLLVMENRIDMAVESQSLSESKRETLAHKVIVLEDQIETSEVKLLSLKADIESHQSILSKLPDVEGDLDNLMKKYELVLSNIKESKSNLNDLRIEIENRNDELSHLTAEVTELRGRQGYLSEQVRLLEGSVLVEQGQQNVSNGN